MTPSTSLNLSPAEAAAYLRRNAKQRGPNDAPITVVFEVPVPGGLGGQGWVMAYAQYQMGIKRRCVLSVRTFPQDRAPNQPDADWVGEFLAEIAAPEGSVALFAQAAGQAPTAAHALGWDEQLYGSGS